LSVDSVENINMYFKEIGWDGGMFWMNLAEEREKGRLL
jgi:hypothetical protein